MLDLIVEQIYNLNQMELPEAPCAKILLLFPSEAYFSWFIIMANTINFHVMVLFIAAFLHQLETPTKSGRESEHAQLSAV